MTTDADGPDAPDTPDPFPNVADRDEVLALVEDGLREAHRKVESGRVYDPENEKVRQGWLRTLGYLANQYRQLRRDEDLEQMRQEIDDLRDRIDDP